MDKKYYVIAECVDERDGQRYFPTPGTTFPNPTKKQAARLVAARCLSDEEPDAADLPKAPNVNDQLIQFADDLGGKTVPQLKKLAEDEKVDLGDATRKTEILAAIRKDRQAKAG